MAVVKSSVGGKDYDGWDAKSTVSADFLLSGDASAVSSSIHRQGRHTRATHGDHHEQVHVKRPGCSIETGLLQSLSAISLGEGEEQRQRSRVRDSLTAVSSTSLSSTATFGSRQTNIDRENARLCRRIQDQLTRPPSKSFSLGPSSATQHRTAAASCVNRHRRDDRIFRENQALLQRIHSAKPSKELSVSEHRKHFAKHLQYSQNASRRRSPCPSSTLRSSAPSKQGDERGLGSRTHLVVQPAWEAGW